MNVLPVIERELRAEARNAITYGSRPLGAALLLLASMMFLNRAVGSSGRELFTELHRFLLATIWLWVPLVSADCISREKREQTLGLLFLTPLKARDIMLAKTLAQGLRAATIGIAVIPVLALPLLLGGLNGPAVVSSILINASTFCWALAAGLLASVLSRSIAASLIWSLLWAAVFLVVLSMLYGGVVFELIHFTTGRPRFFPSLEGVAGMGMLAMWQSEPAFLSGLRAAGIQFWLLGSIAVLVCSLGGLALVWQLGAWHLQTAWQELPPSPARERVGRQFCQPRFAPGIFRRWMRRRLERNPVGWLERRRWTSRAASWIWLGIFGIGYTYSYVNFSDTHQVNELNFLMAAALMGAMALASSASFRRERETGVMELLLTTPLTPEQIVRGRLFGLWAQFLPSLAILVFMFGFSDVLLRWSSPDSNLLVDIWIIGSFFLSVPICGLWLSLALRHHMMSLLLTVAAGILLPYVLANGLTFIYAVALAREPSLGLLVLLALGAGIWGAHQLLRTVSWVGWLAVAAALGGVLFVMCIPSYHSSRYVRDDFWTFAFLSPSFALAVAGISHRKLLRMLRQRTFGFKV